MFRRSFITVAIILFGSLTYFYVVNAVEKKRAGVSLQLASLKASECEEVPTSRCFAELAVLHLPFYVRFSGFDGLGRDLRYLGFGDLVDARTRKDEFEYDEANRQATRLFQLLVASIEAFENAPPNDDPFIYSKVFHKLLDDFPGFGGGWWPDVIRAEKAALLRRGAPSLPRHTDAVLRKWRQALDLHSDHAQNWLLYTSRARELQKIVQAREALSKAVAMGVSDTNDWTVVYETWQLYGVEAAFAAVTEIPDTNFRASTYLNLANRLLAQGDATSAATAFQAFTRNYDEDEPVRLVTAWRRMAKNAALTAYRLGNAEKAAFWAAQYERRSNYGTRTVNALDTAELYVDTGHFDKAVTKAYEAIAHAPEPGQTARGPWLSEVSTTPYYNGYIGRAMGVLCKAGKFDAAFALTEQNPDIGSNAVPGCRVAMEGSNPEMTIRSLAAALSLRSVRQLEELHAATLVETGDYAAASRFIQAALDTPPEQEGGSLAISNLNYLRLAVAMRDERLARDIMRYIAADAASVDGKTASWLFSTVAAYTYKWPDRLISSQN
ncbi:MAG: hypothetical protein KJO31_19355 [Gammaproteobacteria bacterium]|nr:hypothetical protein [Gammaproteobacteria bacterium]